MIGTRRRKHLSATRKLFASSARSLSRCHIEQTSADAVSRVSRIWTALHELIDGEQKLSGFLYDRYLTADRCISMNGVDGTITNKKKMRYSMTTSVYAGFRCSTRENALWSGKPHQIPIRSAHKVFACGFKRSNRDITLDIVANEYGVRCHYDSLLKCIYVAMFRFTNIFCLKISRTFGRYQYTAVCITPAPRIRLAGGFSPDSSGFWVWENLTYAAMWLRFKNCNFNLEGLDRAAWIENIQKIPCHKGRAKAIAREWRMMVSLYNTHDKYPFVCSTYFLFFFLWSCTPSFIREQQSATK